MIRRAYILLVFSVLAGVSSAQQPIYSQYMMNPYLLNPAIAGYQGITDFNLTAREQWFGYAEGPSTYAISGQTRVLKSSFRNRSRMIKNRVRRRRPSGRVGFGGYIYNDINGSIRRTGFQGTYSYHIYVRDIQYSAGVSLSAFQFKANVNSSDLYNEDDLWFHNTAKSVFSPDANIGFLMSGDNFYAGLSTTNLFQSVIRFGAGSSDGAFKLQRHWYVIGGYKYQERRSDYGFEPSIMITYTERKFSQGVFKGSSLDLNFKVFYKEDYWAGLSFRTTGTIISMIGMNYQQFYFGYAFDYSYGDITTFNRTGAHEIMIGMRLGDSARRYRWLNRF